MVPCFFALWRQWIIGNGALLHKSYYYYYYYYCYLPLLVTLCYSWCDQHTSFCLVTAAEHIWLPSVTREVPNTSVCLVTDAFGYHFWLSFVTPDVTNTQSFVWSLLLSTYGYPVLLVKCPTQAFVWSLLLLVTTFGYPVLLLMWPTHKLLFVTAA